MRQAAVEGTWGTPTSSDRVLMITWTSRTMTMLSSISIDTTALQHTHARQRISDTGALPETSTLMVGMRGAHAAHAANERVRNVQEITSGRRAAQTRGRAYR
jgi:hypothetical protein